MSSILEEIEKRPITADQLSSLAASQLIGFFDLSNKAGSWRCANQGLDSKAGYYWLTLANNTSAEAVELRIGQRPPQH
jgi:hypothetical protein